jgi:hypothetical protein
VALRYARQLSRAQPVCRRSIDAHIPGKLPV